MSEPALDDGPTLREIVRERGIRILCIAVAAMFWRPLTNQTFFFRDLYLLFFPKKLLFVRAVRHGLVPLWDPFTNGGQPYLASPANFALHPSNALYFVLPPLTAFNWILVLHVIFAAAAAYWLARIVKIDQAGAFVCGAVFALSGCALSTINLTPLLLALPWVPVTIGLTHRALREGRSIAPAAIAAALPLYGGAAEVTGILFLTLGAWVFAMNYDGVRAGRKVATVAMVVAFAAALSALQTLPATSVIAQSSRRGPRTYESFTTWSVSPQRLFELAVPRFFGPTGTLDDRDYWGRGLESNGFPYFLSIYFGIPVLLLAIAGASGTCAAQLPRRTLAFVGIVSIVASLGRWLPGFHLIYDYVPFVTTFRFPVKALVAALLPVALLAGYAVASVGGRWRKAAFVVSALAAAVAVTIGFSSGSLAAFARLFGFDRPSGPQLAMSFVHTAVAAAALGIAIGLPPRHRRIAIAAVVIIDLALAGYSVNVYAPRSLFDEPPIAGLVRRVTGDGRFHATERETVLQAPTNEVRWLAKWQIATLDGYTASEFGIPVAFQVDYDGLAPRRVAALSKIIDRLPWQKRLPIFTVGGVRCFSTTDVVPGLPQIATIPAPQRPIRFYANPSAAPARFVSSVQVVSGEAAAAKAFVVGASPSRVILERPVAASTPCGSAPVTRIARTLNAASYEVNAPCDGFVAFAESDYDGWRTSVDAQPVAAMRADFAFTAVAVSRGPHRIERRYVPPRLFAGAATTFLALLLLFPAAAILRRGPAT